jgi:FkbM family methyltransferase
MASRDGRGQWLRCEGALPARVAAWMHYAWPYARGQWRFTEILRRTRLKSLSAVPFRSECGVRVVLDIPSNEFLYLSGRLPSEPLEIALMQKMVRPGDVFVDVGAHRGLYILHILGRLGPDGIYLALEPSPTSFDFLVNAFGHADPRLRRLRIAVSEFDGEARLIDEGALTAHLEAHAPGGLPVSTKRLDTLLADIELAGRAVVVKIDTEGHEARVIRGCAGLAARGVRPVFFAEFLPSIFGQKREDVTRAIAETFGGDYRYFGIDLGARGLAEFAPGNPPPGEVRNIFAVPHDQSGRLAGWACG